MHPGQRDWGGSGNPVLELPGHHARKVPPLGLQGNEVPKELNGPRGQNQLELPRISQMSQRLLGCWSGTTVASPTKWQVLSPAGHYLSYSQDLIRLCLTDVNGELHVKYAGSQDAEPTEHPYGITFRPRRAVGKQVEMDLKSWDPDSPESYVETGTARCVLNPDGSVTYSHSITTFLQGKPALLAETRADLAREH